MITILSFTIVQGDKIVGQFKNVDLEKWEDFVKICATYIIQNFELEKNTGHFRASNHALKLSFVKGTKIKEHGLPDILKICSISQCLMM